MTYRPPGSVRYFHRVTVPWLEHTLEVSGWVLPTKWSTIHVEHVTNGGTTLDDGTIAVITSHIPFLIALLGAIHAEEAEEGGQAEIEEAEADLSSLLDERLEGLEGLQAQHIEGLQALVAAADGGDYVSTMAFLAIQDHRDDGDAGCGWPAILDEWASVAL